MSRSAKDLADLLASIVHQPRGTTTGHQLIHDSRVLASVLIQALHLHSPADIAAWIRWRLRTSQRPDQRRIAALDKAELICQLNDVKRVRKVSVKRKRNGSKLDPYRAELIALRKSGASWNDLRTWLRRYPRIKVDRSTVIRRVSLWLRESDG